MKKLFVIFTAMALVGIFTLSATAANWDFYGSARFSTFYDSADDDYSGGNSKADMKDDAGTTWALQGNSRIGANVKLNDEIGGRFEYGTGVNLRHLYGTWDFNGSQLLVGHTYTPIYQGYSDQVWDTDQGMSKWGNTDPGRNSMIQLKTGGFKIAIVKPNDKTPTLPPDTTYDVDILLPKLEVSYCMKTDLFFFDVNAGAQTYSMENNTLDENVASYVVGGDFGMDFGLVGFVIKGHYALNGAQYGLLAATSDNSAVNKAGNDIDNNTTYAFMGVINIKPTDTLDIQAGAGYSASELDIRGADTDDSICAYANAKVTVIPGLFIVPEVGIISEGDDSKGNDQGSAFYAGAKWQINF